MARANARRNGELRSQEWEGRSTEEEDVVVARQTMTPSPSVSSALIRAKDTRTKMGIHRVVNRHRTSRSLHASTCFSRRVDGCGCVLGQLNDVEQIQEKVTAGRAIDGLGGDWHADQC